MAHYFFDGRWPISVGGPKRVPLINTRSVEEGATAAEMNADYTAIEKLVPALVEINDSPKRLRGFELNKVRFHIVERGQFAVE